jgi:AraC family transcriptional regulator
MMERVLPACDYVAYTHRGLESDLGATHNKLYGAWMQEHDRRPAGFDYEIWDEPFQPEESHNEIDLYIALAGD